MLLEATPAAERSQARVPQAAVMIIDNATASFILKAYLLAVAVDRLVARETMRCIFLPLHPPLFAPTVSGGQHHEDRRE
jgi:hypothetical protein